MRFVDISTKSYFKYKLRYMIYNAIDDKFYKMLTL